ncbi:MAG: hypothetical protein NC225_02700 [Clostridium sp.]|nr:hypothetical protein [Clostridium sp.]MCM1458962.1 hypothetical protein [Bacteroides sp.]
MLHIEFDAVKERILEGCFGLEKESLRIKKDGTLSHSLHPFPNDTHIVKDFCENQTEINTSVHNSAKEAIEELEFHNRRIYESLKALSEREYLWPFSNPPYIQNESDIPVAVFEGIEVSKTAYREYLSAKYGKYKMTFSGIHVNYSFSEELLKADYEHQEGLAYQEFKNTFYLELAQKLAMYGWLLVAVTAASPVLDSSFVEKGIYGQDVFTGMASVRCGEMGYWNEFAPIFDYRDISAYAGSIQKYVDMGLLKAASELYYPIRLKPKGENNLESLCKNGVNHIELRMFDLNPLVSTGVDERDIIFAQLLMVWLASTPNQPLSEKDQIQAVQNFKNAARYDLKTVNILTPKGETYSVADAALKVIGIMREFFNRLSLDVDEILQFEYEKFTDAENRYAWKIRKQFGGGYVKKGLELVMERQGK